MLSPFDEKNYRTHQIYAFIDIKEGEKVGYTNKALRTNSTPILLFYPSVKWVGGFDIEVPQYVHDDCLVFRTTEDLSLAQLEIFVAWVL